MPPITPGTRVCAVLGDPVSHSLSPAVHNAALRASGKDIVYVAHRVRRLAEAFQGVRALENHLGCSLTLPHKEEAARLVDELDETARAIGAINTVTRLEDGRLSGTNTDGPGALEALRRAGADPARQAILLLGAGGAARGLAMTFAREALPSSIVVLSRTEERAQRLAADASRHAPVRGGSLTPDVLEEEIPRASIVVNTTPLGMGPALDETPLPARYLRPEQAVMDIVYNPLETRLLREARERGCRTIDGLEMFVAQAARQFRIWTGEAAPMEIMRNAALAALPPRGPRS